MVRGSQRVNQTTQGYHAMQHEEMTDRMPAATTERRRHPHLPNPDGLGPFLSRKR